MIRHKLKQKLKNGINNLLFSLGYSLVRISSQQAHGTMDGAFRNIVKRKHYFNTVIDVGASNGSWSLSFMRFFPLCQYLLIEAQPVHEKSLNKFVKKHKNAHLSLAAAANSVGHIYFDTSDPFGGQASHIPYRSNNIQVPAITIDNEICTRKLPGPYLIKLDTHGFEVPILTGAFNTLTETEVIIMECYNFRITKNCLLFYEMCDYLKVFKFRCIDLVDASHRPYDNSFWQMDLVFVKEKRPEFLYSMYK